MRHCPINAFVSCFRKHLTELFGKLHGWCRGSGCSIPKFYVREVGRPGWWKPEGNSESEIENAILEKVFPLGNDGCLSLFAIFGDDDIRRIAVALNKNHGGHNSPVRLLRIVPAELGNLKRERTLGRTSCIYANNLHYDVVVGRAEMLKSMVQQLRADGRELDTHSKQLMKKYRDNAEQEGCHAAVDSTSKCVCEA